MQDSQATPETGVKAPLTGELVDSGVNPPLTPDGGMPPRGEPVVEVDPHAYVPILDTLPEPPDRRERPWERAFLTAFRMTGNQTRAAQAAGICASQVCQLRKRSRQFALAYDEACEEACDILEEEARRRALYGSDEPVIHLGKQQFTWVDDRGVPVPEGTEGARMVPLTIKKYSDTLLIFLLKGARPHKYRDNFKLEHHYGNLDQQIAEQLARLAPPQLESQPKTQHETQHEDTPGTAN